VSRSSSKRSHLFLNEWDRTYPTRFPCTWLPKRMPKGINWAFIQRYSPCNVMFDCNALFETNWNRFGMTKRRPRTKLYCSRVRFCSIKEVFDFRTFDCVRLCSIGKTPGWVRLCSIAEPNPNQSNDWSSIEFDYRTFDWFTSGIKQQQITSNNWLTEAIKDWHTRAGQFNRSQITRTFWKCK